MIKELYNHTKELPDFKIYSILLFSSKHPHVIKVLKDPEYYKALDAITGTHIALFFTRLFEGHMETPSSSQGTLRFMIPIWKEPEENIKLLQLLDMKSSENLPCLVTFLFHNEAIHTTYSSINQKSEHQAFNSIEEILQKLNNASKNSIDKYQAISEAKFEMKKLNFKKGLAIFIERISMFRGVSGI